jgi:cytochrome c biogenesis protein CcmG, thiol:disulfide interchange protein DsbE
MRRRLLLAVAGIAVALVLLQVVGARSEGGPYDAAPTFEVPQLDGDGVITLTSLRGSPVVLNFWATWCVPCREEMPDLEAVHADLGDRVRFVGINNRDTRRVARVFLRETGVTYPSGFDPRGQVAAAYEILGMPTTILIRGDGTIAQKRTGAVSERQLRRMIEEEFGVG